MRLDEKKILDYLKNHVGENTTTYRLVEDAGAVDGDVDEMEMDSTVRRIAEENKFRLNSDHHYNQVIGLPWNIDFYIEEYDREKVIDRITNERSVTKRVLMIQEEYGIFNEEGNLVEFRYDLPDELRKIYDEDSAWLEKKQNEGIDID